ncbi:MAG TPA: tRNA dihydrouridine synthase DusB [Candidatus Fimimorpha faecalis]|uniref:tRNA-dihydrouridine synthase n=1 Tax=Candidatus Fimimorpha faecalis TaxID=2840824 RepID=A0A9D1EFH1_9FIRM|nr:tRNA dihydrouridine synthase DusB [Candidatus Fimimorpha faecalis]
MAGLKIGTIRLKHGIVLGPMAGVTDLPYRVLCKEMGCELLYTEMVSAKAIYYKNKNTKPLLEVDKTEHPIAVQLFGSDPKLIAEMAKQLEEGPYDIFDVNMGCPVPKVVNNGEGSALMKNPKLAAEILAELVKAVKKPVTVKFRKGFTESTVNAVEFAKAAEASGVSAIAVHGRTREQYYSGKADWEIIRQVKKAVSIPVIGNGDITCAADAKRMMEETGCDGIMVARAARGNPWIFREIKQFFETGTIPERPSWEEVIQMILRHGQMQIEFSGEYMGIRQMRKHVAWYTAGMPHSAAIRRASNEVESLEQLEAILRRV